MTRTTTNYWNKKKCDYFEIHKQAHANAAELLKEAKILFDNKCYPRAYFLAYTALEELSKSQHAADVFTDFSKERDFNESYKNHHDKIERIRWAHNDAIAWPHNFIWLGPDIDDFEKIAPSEPSWEKRQNSLYVGADHSNINIPKKEITQDDAREIIHIIDTAFERIWEVSGEFGGNQIGTRGFMK